MAGDGPGSETLLRQDMEVSGPMNLEKIKQDKMKVRSDIAEQWWILVLVISTILGIVMWSLLNVALT